MENKNENDPMADAIRNSDTTKNDEAARMQADIDEKERLRAAAIRADEHETISRMAREQAERDRLRPATPITQSTGAHVARPGEETVTMNFPREMFIWAEPVKDAEPGSPQAKRFKVVFRKGLQEVPVSLADNWYLRECGVERYEGGPARDTRPEAAKDLKPDPSRGIVA
jgi:hypothetical protein